jgi:hypothetical protein
MEEKNIWLKDLKSFIAQQIQLEIKRANEKQTQGLVSPPRSPRDSTRDSLSSSFREKEKEREREREKEKEKEKEKEREREKEKSNSAIKEKIKSGAEDSFTPPGLSILATVSGGPVLSPRGIGGIDYSSLVEAQPAVSPIASTRAALISRIARSGGQPTAPLTIPTLAPQRELYNLQQLQHEPPLL